MIEIKSLWDYVAPEVNGCPYPLISRAIIQAARELCERSKIWREGADNTLALPGIPFCLDVIPADAELISVDYVLYEKRDLYPITEYTLSGKGLYWRDDEAVMPSHYITNINTKEISLYPKVLPGEKGKVAYEVTLRPSMKATKLPEFLTVDFLDALTNGALNRLLQMRGTEWYDPLEADRKKMLFKQGVYKARSVVTRGISSHDTSSIISPLV